MTGRSRARGIAKWWALAMCVLLLLALLLSLRRGTYVLRPGDRILEYNGKTVYSFKDLIPELASTSKPVKLKVRDGAGNVHVAHVPARAWAGIASPVSVPLGLAFVIAAGITALLFWRDRRFPAGHCQKCGYDLTGNVSGRCPECGTPVPDTSAEGESA